MAGVDTMIITYDKTTGEIKSKVTGNLSPSDFNNPVIEVNDGVSLDNKEVDVKTGELTWKHTLIESKDNKINQIKNRANKILSKTDWYVVRRQETDKSIPQSVVDHRSEVRSLSDQFESEVNSLDSVSEVLKYQFSYPDPPEP